MIKWSQLNWWGKLNYIFFWANLFMSVHLASMGSLSFILNFLVSFICYIACFAPISQKYHN